MCSAVVTGSFPDCVLLVVQFSLLNGSMHDSWLQQGHEGMPMDEEMRSRCEVLARIRPPPNEPHRKKPDRASEVHAYVENTILITSELFPLPSFFDRIEDRNQHGD